MENTSLMVSLTYFHADTLSNLPEKMAFRLESLTLANAETSTSMLHVHIYTVHKGLNLKLVTSRDGHVTRTRAVPRFRPLLAFEFRLVVL